jgi:hypothetical protein
MENMPGARLRIVASAVVSVGALASGCSSSGTAQRTPSTASPSADTQTIAVQKYVDAVNKLCDELLPKIVAVTKGGSFDIPLKEFFAQLPAHAKLRADFDQQLARVPVPAEAEDEARILGAYIRFANELDAKRLRAAKQGQASYHREIRAEKKYAATDPTITARNAAGFNESCNAR